MRYEVIKLDVEQKKPPWYWRLIGRVYWKGWVVRVQVLAHNGTTKTFASVPAKEAPNPRAVANTASQLVIKAVNELEKSRGA